MSYDLYFLGRDISRADFTAYFKERSNYKGEVPQVFYQNEDTGVYFSFELNEREKNADPKAPKQEIAFNINFFRPHIFGLEAEPEVQAFVEAFKFSVSDPQSHGMGEGAYSREGFLKGWNAGNEFGFKAVLGNPNTDFKTIFTYPGWHIEQMWKWNFARKKVQEKLTDNIFVPKIMFFRKEGKTASMAVWPDAISALIPEVDFLLIPRRELAPSSFFQKKEDKCIIAFSEAAKLLAPYLTYDYGLAAYLLANPVTPRELSDFVRGLKPFTGKMEGISVDQVLDAELVSKYHP